MVRKFIFCMCMTMLPLTAFPQVAIVVKEGAKAAGKNVSKAVRTGAKTGAKTAGKKVMNKQGVQLFEDMTAPLSEKVTAKEITQLRLKLQQYNSQIKVTDDFVSKVYGICAKKGLNGKDLKEVVEQFNSFRKTTIPKELNYFKPSKEVSIGEWSHSAIRHSVSSHSKNRTFFSDEYMKTHLQEDMIKLKRNRKSFFVSNAQEGARGDQYIMRYDKPVGKDTKGNEFCDIMFYMDKNGKIISSFPLSEIVKGIKMKEYSFRDLYNKIPVTPATW